MLHTNIEQTSRKYRIAAYNEQLHMNQICPGNHSVEYAYGWYYFDGDARRCPLATKNARVAEESEEIVVAYNSGWNTYVLHALPR
jgi:hypothetical protein